MKEYYRFFSLAVAILFVMALCNSCDRPEDPEFPSFVSYHITGDILSYDGPEQMLPDIKAWLRANDLSYDTKLDYSTGDASEFTESDIEAVKKYQQQYLPKFRTYLNELHAKIDAGTYGKLDNVKITFCTYASRTQGKQNTLAYDQHEFSYPSANLQ